MVKINSFAHTEVAAWILAQRNVSSTPASASAGSEGVRVNPALNVQALESDSDAARLWIRQCIIEGVDFTGRVREPLVRATDEPPLVFDGNMVRFRDPQSLPSLSAVVNLGSSQDE